MRNQTKTFKKAAKPNIKVRDLKPSKDAKGGATFGPMPIIKPIDKGSP
jgi:hypothetical protein